MKTIKIELTVDLTNPTEKAALDAFFEALNPSRSVTESKPKAVTESKLKTVKKEEPETTKDKLDESQIKLEDIRLSLATKVQDHRDAIKEKLAELGAKNVSTLDASHYEVFLGFLDKL